MLELIQLPEDGDRAKMSCRVTEVADADSADVTDEGIFSSRLESGACHLILARPDMLDRERSSEYSVRVAVDARSAFTNPRRRAATVTVRVGDANDSQPRSVSLAVLCSRIYSHISVLL